MPADDSRSPAESTAPPTADELRRIRSWLRWLTAGMFLTVLALFAEYSAVLGLIVDFHYGEGLLIGGVTAGGVMVGFLFGWLAARAVGRVG